MTDHGMIGVKGPYSNYWATCSIYQPSTPTLGDLSILIKVSATDERYGVGKVHFYWTYCPLVGGSYVCGAYNYLGYSDTKVGSYYEKLWTFPSCGDCPGDRFQIYVTVENAYGRISRQVAAYNVRLVGRGC